MTISSSENDLSPAFRILVVDDEDVARSVQRVLQPDDVIVGVTDPIDACDRIRQAETEGAPFDAVFCRIDIDDTRGRGILRVVQACTAPPMFIYLARYSDEGIEAIKPADGILIKPFTGPEIEDLITKIVLERDRERTRRLLSDHYN